MSVGNAHTKILTAEGTLIIGAPFMLRGAKRLQCRRQGS
jgi:hypothetical protein